MDLGYVFKVSLYSLTVLVGMILGFAETDGTSYGIHQYKIALPFLSLPVVACGYLLTEHRRAKDSNGASGLKPGWANLLGIAALIATGYEFSSENHEGKLLAGTHLLLYATWIVLFQQKTVRLYWFLMALGILQLAVASVLTTKGWFGFCALLYTFGAVWTLSIFSLWRAEQHFKEEEQIRFAVATGAPPTAQLPSTNGTPQQSEVHGSVQHEGGAQWLTARFVTGVLLTTCSALVVSAAFFAFIPRVWSGASVTLNNDPDRLPATSRKTGLSSSIRLGDLGPILESLDRVFEIQIVDLKSRKVLSAQEYAERLGLVEPLFRATILTHYNSGMWSSDSLDGLHRKPFERSDAAWDIEQQIQRDTNDSQVLFCMGHPLMVLDARRQMYGNLNEMTDIVMRSDPKSETGPVAYSVFSGLPEKTPLHYQQPVKPSIRNTYLRTRYLDKASRLPKKMDQLKGIAHRIVEEEEERLRKAEGDQTPRELTKMEIAQALESHLRDSGEYRYSLDLSIVDPSIDPVEDFLINRKAGHCEYFATALALMLRAERIPARVVTGYKGGIPNPDRGEWLEVQQRFAHAWVEAWIDDNGWTTLDATPAAERSISIAAMSAKKGSIWTEMQSTLAGLWSENILNMSLDRQEESIYKPMRELAMSLLTLFRKLIASPQSALEAFVELLRNREQWFSIGGGLFALALMLALVGLHWIYRRILNAIRTWWGGQSGRRSQQKYRIVEFYERFIKLLNRHGLNRGPSQTQSEFADLVSRTYASELSSAGIDGFPNEISRLFYQVRFGEQTLSPPEARRVEDLLARFSQALANHADTAQEAGNSSPPQSSK